MALADAVAERSKLTGYAPSPATGVSPSAEHPEIELHDEDFPINLFFNGRRYVLLRTRNGGLLINGR